MTTFQTMLLLVLVILAAILLYAVISKDGIVITYRKTITNINKLDDLQLEIAKANLEELKKYNENASKQTEDNNKVVQSITSAVQEFMGVGNEEE